MGLVFKHDTIYSSIESVSCEYIYIIKEHGI